MDNYTTIDKLDISVYNMYALRTRMVEDIKREFHLEEARAVSSQTQISITQAQVREMDRLMGLTSTSVTTMPWAFFFPPDFFYQARFTPFTFAYIAPGLKKKNEEDEDEIEGMACDDEEGKEEKKAILGCLKVIRKLNQWLGFVRGRMGQFLQA